MRILCVRRCLCIVVFQWIFFLNVFHSCRQCDWSQCEVWHSNPYACVEWRFIYSVGNDYINIKIKKFFFHSMIWLQFLIIILIEISLELTFFNSFQVLKNITRKWIVVWIGYECVSRIEKIILRECRALSREHKLKFVAIVVPQVCVVSFTD